MAKLISCGANQISLEQLLRLSSRQAAIKQQVQIIIIIWLCAKRALVAFHLDGPLKFIYICTVRLHLSRRRSGWKLEITRISAFKGCVPICSQHTPQKKHSSSQFHNLWRAWNNLSRLSEKETTINHPGEQHTHTQGFQISGEEGNSRAREKSNCTRPPEIKQPPAEKGVVSALFLSLSLSLAV
jgi:hypothetical protein